MVVPHPYAMVSTEYGISQLLTPRLVVVLVTVAVNGTGTVLVEYTVRFSTG